MTDHLPFINHLAAREAGKSLAEFDALSEAEKQEWMKFALEGPSKFRETLMIAEIRNMFRDFLTGAKTLTPLDENWIDAVFEHPAATFERNIKAARKAKRDAAIKRAKERHEREQRATAGREIVNG